MTSLFELIAKKSLPLVNKLIFSSNDLLAARDHLAGLLWPHALKPTKRLSKLAFQHNRASVGQIGISSIHYGPAIKLDVQSSDDSYLLHMPLSGGGEVIRGGCSFDVNAGDLVVFNPGQPFKMFLSEGQSNLTVRLPGALLREFIERETGRAVSDALEFYGGEQFQHADVDGVARFISYLCEELNQQGRPLVPSVARQLQQTLISLVLSHMPHSYSEIMGGVSSVPAPGYIQRVVDFIATDYSEPLTLQQLADLAAVTPRTLQNGFRQFYNLTPMEYLRDCRLESTRQLLTGSTAAGQTVTQIAMRCGFQHLSKFAKCYRERFGESPSETRKANWRLV